MVELHSFVPASSTAQKLANWGHLNRKVLSKLNLRVPEELIQQLVQSRPGMAEKVLLQLRDRIEERQRHSKEGAGEGGRMWGSPQPVQLQEGSVLVLPTCRVLCQGGDEPPPGGRGGRCHAPAAGGAGAGAALG
ncbi:SPEF1 protein, partial [Scytalopus superciliaris]|nr:SPEF1 protein [Scytalopus superciliaris]